MLYDFGNNPEVPYNFENKLEVSMISKERPEVSMMPITNPTESGFRKPGLKNLHHGLAKQPHIRKVVLVWRRADGVARLWGSLVPNYPLV